MKQVPLLLLVPLALVSFGFSALVPQQAPPAKVWRQSQKTSPGHDTTYTRFTFVGRFLKAPQGTVGDVSNRPAFVVDCVPAKGSHKGKFIAGNLLIGTALKIDYVEPQEIHGTSYYPKVAVQYRIDDAKEPEKENWTPGTEKTSASIPKDSLKKILRAQAVDLTVDDEQGSQVVMKFDMPVPTLVEDACNVDDRKK
jgi:isochorismate synthase EntC